MRITLYVQHLLGSGHLVRMRVLAGALHRAGHQVSLVSGGAFDGAVEYEVVQLPVLKTRAGDFLTLLDASGEPVNEAWKARRRDRLLLELERLRPEILVLETWPFGRRQLEFEILPMLDAVTRRAHPPRVVTSIRDVLQERRPVRRKETLERLRDSISLVLVHGDEEAIDLSVSFPEAAEIPCPLHYTGYVTEERLKFPDSADGNDEVLVSAGGGGAGLRLLETAMDAARLQARRKWRVLAGDRVEPETFARWQARQSDALIVARNRRDFPDLLTRCAVSVSQLGYNTAVDLATAGCPAVVVPYASDGETEQATRAARFAELGLVTLLPEAMLTPESMLDAVESAAAGRRELKIPRLRVDGAARSVDILEQLHESLRHDTLR